MKKILLTFLFSFLSLFSGVAFAQTPSSGQILDGRTLNIVSDQGGAGKLQDLVGGGNEAQFGGMMQKIVIFVRQFSIPLGIIVLVIAGIQLIANRGNEDLFKAKIRQTLYLVLGFFLIISADVIVYYMFFGPTGEIFDGLNNDSATFALEFNNQIIGAVDFMTTFAVAILVLLVVIASFQMILGAGGDDGREALKKRLIWGSVGILIMSLANRITFYFFGYGEGGAAGQFSIPSPVSIVIETVRWINFILGYIAFLAIVAIIVAGLYILFYFGNDDNVNKGKTIIKSAIIGLIVALSGWVFIKFFIFPFLN